MKWTARVRVRGEREAALLTRVQVRVPGTRVVTRGDLATLTIADHGVDLLHALMVQERLEFSWDYVDAKTEAKWAQDPTDVANRVIAGLVRDCIMRPGVPFTDYQLRDLGRAIIRGNFHLWFPPGAGKTRPAIVWALGARELDTVVTTRVAAVWTFAKEVETVSLVEPHVWLPKSKRRKSYEHTGSYVRRMRARGQRPFIITGWENLTAAGDEVVTALEVAGRKAKFSWIADEIHRVRSHSRWEHSYNEDGEDQFTLKDNQAAAAMLLSKAASRRLGLTGTPIPDRLRGLWAQLDLIGPWEFGKFYDWAVRYCAGRPGQFAYMDTSGKSNIAELRDRLAYTTATVSLDVVRASLPGIAREMLRLDASELVKPEGGWKRELGRALKAGGEDALEANLMIAAGKKRKWIADLVSEALRAGQKIIVFTGRRRDAEALSAAIEKAAPAGAWVRWTHGESDSHERFALCEEYMCQEGAACLSATGDSIGESLNLQDTDLLVMAMLPWTPGQVIQWEGRVCRIGQKRRTRIVYPIAEGTADERVAEVLLDKLPVVEEIVGEREAGRIVSVLKTHDDDEAILKRILENMPLGEWRITDRED